MTLTRNYVPLLRIMAVIAIILSFASPSLAAQKKSRAIPPSVEAQLDAHIKHYIEECEAEECPDRGPDDHPACHGEEYKKARRFCFGDLNGDGKEDIAVLYTLESFCCGNNYQFYLAVFLKEGSGFKLIASENVGGKGNREIGFNKIKGGKILLNTFEYLPKDGMCCPSAKGRTSYSLKNGKLIENGQAGKKPRSGIERLRQAWNRAPNFTEQQEKKGE